MKIAVTKSQIEAVVLMTKWLEGKGLATPALVVCAVAGEVQAAPAMAIIEDCLMRDVLRRGEMLDGLQTRTTLSAAHLPVRERG